MAVKLTSRKVKSTTGIDISVPSFDSAPTPRQVKNYHVVVITKLSHFKLAEHSDDDIVQFMVPRDYESFETLHKELVEELSMKLPDLPKKFNVFMGDDDIYERQVSFDCLMKVLARDPEKCTCTPLLRFLKVSPDADKKYCTARKEYLEKKAKGVQKVQGLFEKAEAGLFDLQDDDEMKAIAKKEPSTLSTASIPSAAANQITGQASILETEDIFIPKEAQVETVHTDDFQLEDNSDLLNITESFDDVLKITKKNEATSKDSTATDKARKIKAKELFDDDDDDNTSNLNTDDILKYIKQQEDKSSENDDLF